MNKINIAGYYSKLTKTCKNSTTKTNEKWMSFFESAS